MALHFEHFFPRMYINSRESLHALRCTADTCDLLSEVGGDEGVGVAGEQRPRQLRVQHQVEEQLHRGRGREAERGHAEHERRGRVQRDGGHGVGEVRRREQHHRHRQGRGQSVNLAHQFPFPLDFVQISAVEKDDGEYPYHRNLKIDRKKIRCC